MMNKIMNKTMNKTMNNKLKTFLIYSINDSIQHLHDAHGITVDQNQITELRNIGYSTVPVMVN